MSTRPVVHVHHLIDTLGTGGAEVLLVELAKVADAGGFRVTVGYLQDKGGGMVRGRLLEAGVEARLVAIPPRLGQAALRRTRAHLTAVSPDILHTHLAHSDLLGGMAAMTLRMPAVSTMHQEAWFQEDATARARWRVRLAAHVRRAADQRVITVSERSRLSYLATGWDRPARVVAVRNGIGGRAEPGAGARVRQELGIAPDELVVGMLSALRPVKRHDIAIEAFRALSEGRRSLRLVVAGDGPHREAVRDAALPLGDRVVLAGYRGDTMALLDAYDVLLQPSYHEALPTSCIEAMAAGVPVIATDVGGTREVVVDGETGVLVAAAAGPREVADALATLLDDPARRLALGAAGRARFEAEFTAERWAKSLGDIYRDVLSAR